MTSKRRPRWPVVVGIVLLLVLAGCLLGVMVMLNNSPSARLQAARARWEESGIDSYHAVVEARVPLADWSDYAITVQDGTVVEASWIPLAGMYGSETDYSPISPSQAADYTIDALFNKAASRLDAHPVLDLSICRTRYRVDFDETLGYITLYSQNDCQWLPVICPQVSECSSSYRVTDFEPISTNMQGE